MKKHEIYKSKDIFVVNRHIRRTGLLICMLIILLLTGCAKAPYINEEKCEEMALNYMEEKYGIEFVVDYSHAYNRSDYKHAEVIVKKKEDEGNENGRRYWVTIYPDGEDEDEDEYYENYIIVSDNYMCDVVWEYAKNEMNRLLYEVGLQRFMITIEIKEMPTKSGFWGFSSDFPIYKEDEFIIEKY